MTDEELEIEEKWFIGTSANGCRRYTKDELPRAGDMMDARLARNKSGLSPIEREFMRQVEMIRDGGELEDYASQIEQMQVAGSSVVNNT